MTRPLQAFLFFVLCVTVNLVSAQPPKPTGTADILLSFKKLKNTATVLYIAAHPDDENTRLLAYLANDRCVRTGYLSLTRGDGGQNLIGDEQGIELGMIRTQELLAARRIDGAEQFFSRAFDFGYSKSPEETLEIWGHQKILSDVVWVIRRFKPDVVITRFPTTGEGGHGHHTASAILAVEAVEAASDPTRFPEQLAYGVKPWKVERLFWNTFRFGSVNTQKEDQLKMDVGAYNPLLGQWYGEISAHSRSQHKSQGFGVPSQRGSILEYFSQLAGEKAKSDILEDINQGWDRYGLNQLDSSIDQLIRSFNPHAPYKSVPALLQIRKRISAAALDSISKSFKLAQVDKLLISLSETYVEATAAEQVNVVGDTALFTLLAISPISTQAKEIEVSIGDSVWQLKPMVNNEPIQKQVRILVPSQWLSQPYWLKEPMGTGAFTISLQTDIGLPQKPSLVSTWKVTWDDGTVSFIQKPVQYKYTDPVKGELYEPVVFAQPVAARMDPPVLLANNHNFQEKNVEVEISSLAHSPLKGITVTLNGKEDKLNFMSGAEGIPPGGKRTVSLMIDPSSVSLGGSAILPLLDKSGKVIQQLHKISYDHIPDIFYHSDCTVKLLNTDIRIVGKKIGYIPGAGDKMVAGLEQMGYQVEVLSEAQIRQGSLTGFDAIVTGVRAYNVNAWLGDVYPVLMQYVKNGGVLLVQYNTNNILGPLKGKIGPYPFEISRDRITDEQAEVEFINPKDSLLHYPNEITQHDFKDWVQERSIYQAGKTDNHYRTLFQMKDPKQEPNTGSLIAANFGKGRFIYTGLVFFREIPAGVPGAYRLLANLLANPNSKLK
ncbi:MAG: PIG-L family deacetylase [Chitinophagaceae bacterium]|nr:PIG-L family deacetylase [Chitinophagaceae bacterium]MCW5915853.1 PIG-L family deacetylase [Ferruginibacter sp.]